ncbi:MAG: glycosyltransferase family 4 protein [Kiritimatiellales bacterium]|nr:glycosyltransferase family 4 protein [Kiritimatiellales bacterium]
MRRFSLEKWGGTETVVFNISRAMAQQGIECSIRCTNMFSRSGYEAMDGVQIKRFSYLFPWIGLSANAKARLRLKGGSPLALPLFFSLLREKDVSIIHTHVQHRLGGMARTAAKLKRIPYVVSIHGGHFTIPAEQNEKMIDPFRGKPEWGKLFGFLFGARRTLQDADAVICVGENECREVQKRFPAKRVSYIPNGVHVDMFAGADGAAFREKYGFQSSEKMILCLSRIDYQKNQLGLVRAFAEFAAGHPEYRLVLIGPVTVEAYHAEVVREIETLDITERVLVIEGFKPDDPLLPSAYKAAEMFVLPTHHEPFGIVILEAWAARVPVIATRIGGIPGFTTDEENILLVEKDDQRQLVGQLERLSADESLRRRLAENAYREVSEKYDWSIIARRVREVYEQTICDYKP